MQCCRSHLSWFYLTLQLLSTRVKRRRYSLTINSDQCCGQQWTELIVMRHDDRAPGLHGSTVKPSTEVYSPANIPFVMPTLPYVRQLNCASTWENGKMDLIMNVGSALLKEPSSGDELQLTGRRTEPTRRCVIYFICASGSF